MITIYKATIFKEQQLLYGIHAWNFQNHVDSIFVEFVTILTKFELLHELSPVKKGITPSSPRVPAPTSMSHRS